jgi:ribose transport system substrate-binding protein
MSLLDRRVRLTPLLLLSVLLSGGCSRKASEPVIGVTLLTKEHVFYNELERGMREEAQKQGFRLVVTSGDWDLARQQNQIKDFITRRVSAIVVCPVNSSGVGPAIAEARQAGIPVFTADIRALNAPVVSHIASDNREGGRLAGKFMGQLLAGRREAKIAIIHQPVTETARERVAGFQEAIAAFPNVKVVATPNGDGVRDRAMRAAEDVLQAFPDLAGFFGINDDSALGAVAAIESAGRKGLVVVGFDATPEARDAIRRGAALKGDIAQQPGEIGRKTVQTVAAHLRGEPVPGTVPIPVQLIDR